LDRGRILLGSTLGGGLMSVFYYLFFVVVAVMLGVPLIEIFWKAPRQLKVLHLLSVEIFGYAAAASISPYTPYKIPLSQSPLILYLMEAVGIAFIIATVELHRRWKIKEQWRIEE